MCLISARILRVAAWVLSVLTVSCVGGTVDAGIRHSISANSDDLSDVIQLPLAGGRLAAGPLLDALADDLHWSVALGRSLHRDFAERAGGGSETAELDSVQIAELVRMFPAVFTLETDRMTGETALKIDRQVLKQTLSDRKRAMRSRLADWTGLEIAAMRRLESTWPPAGETPHRIVVVLHGFHSTERMGQIMAEQLHEAVGLPMVLFLYPNDAAVAESAGYLAKHLEALTREFPDSRVTLLAYSLGGLVSRAVLELPEYAALEAVPRIDHLILVCPPNHGSGLWEYAPLLEGAELWQRRSEPMLLGRQLRRMAGAIVDGMNEASQDLNPDSTFLRQLNSQPRQSHIRYTIIAGDRGAVRPATGGLLKLALQPLRDATQDGPLIARLNAAANLPELQSGHGDGVVTVESTRLADVDDWQVLPIHHLSWGQVDTAHGQRLLAALIERLEKP